MLFSSEIWKFLKTPILKNIFERLLLLLIEVCLSTHSSLHKVMGRNNMPGDIILIFYDDNNHSASK